MTIKPSWVKAFFILAVSSSIAFFGILIAISIADQENILSALSASSFGGIIVFLLVAIALLPSLLFRRIFIHNNRLIYNYLLGRQELAIEDIIRIEEVVIRSRYGETPSIKFVTIDKKKLMFSYKIFREKDLKRLIQEILKINPKIKNEFDAIVIES